MRTRRIATLPVGHMGKFKLLKASPRKVITATNQWAEANPKLIKVLISEINIVVWGEEEDESHRDRLRSTL